MPIANLGRTINRFYVAHRLRRPQAVNLLYCRFLPDRFELEIGRSTTGYQVFK
jgi:hypothetical protein